MRSPPAVLAVDVGNSHLTVTRLVGTDVERVERASARAAADWQAALDRQLTPEPSACVLGSVGRAGPEVEAWLRARTGAPVTAFRSGADLPVATTVREPSRLGVDRVAAALGAFDRQGGAVLVADIGTAITADWMDASGVFQGGSIVPGRALCLRALREGTAQLPEVELWRDDDLRPLPGRDTQEAICHGLDRGLVALVEGLVAGLREGAGGDVPLWITGGDARWFRARTRLGLREDPHLVARGLVLAARRREGADA